MWPPKIPKCPKPLAEFFGALIERHNAGWPIDGFGIKCLDGEGGRSINSTGTTSGGGASAAVLTPLMVIEEPDETDFLVRVVKGQVAARNDCFSPGDDPIFTLEVADGDSVYTDLTVSYNSGTGVWSATDLDVAAAPSKPANTATHWYYEIKDVTIDGDDVMHLGGGVNGNIGWRRCGTTSVFTDEAYRGP